MDKAKEDSWKNLMKYASGFHNCTSGFEAPPKQEPLAQNRILTELKEIQNDYMLNIQADASKHSIFMWDITFPAPNGKAVRAKLHFDSHYPFLPPRMFIKQRLFHPNISVRGEVCLQAFENIWTPGHQVWSLILSVQSLLSDPNPNDPINGIAAKMLLQTPEAYHNYALECFEMLDFFNDEGEDCEENDEYCCKKVELDDSQELNEEETSRNDENNSFVKVESDDTKEINDEGISQNLEKNSLVKVEPEDNKELNDEAISQNDENNSIAKVEPEDSPGLKPGEIFQNDDNNSFVNVKPDDSQELNDEDIFQLEEEILIQHILHNTFLN